MCRCYRLLTRKYGEQGRGLRHRVIVAPLAQVEWHDTDLRPSISPEKAQRGESLLWGKAGDATARQTPAPIAPGRQTDLGPRPPIDRQRRQPVGTAVMREGIQKGVRRRVVPLAGRAQERGRGGE